MDLCKGRAGAIGDMPRGRAERRNTLRYPGRAAFPDAGGPVKGGGAAFFIRDADWRGHLQRDPESVR